jgi:metal-dependent HD superfamily phosphatase/phosphodiesterase
MSDSDDGVEPYRPEDSHAFPDERLNAVLETILDDPEVEAYLEAQNVNPVVRKGYNDHGTKHVEIVRNRALRLYELLKRGGVRFNGATDQGLEEADESVIIALAATLHDIGHVVHRDDHPYYSIPLAADILDRNGRGSSRQVGGASCDPVSPRRGGTPHHGGRRNQGRRRA